MRVTLRATAQTNRGRFARLYAIFQCHGHLLDSRREVRLIHSDRTRRDCTYLHISNRFDRGLCKKEHFLGKQTCQSSALRSTSVAFGVYIFHFHCRLSTYLILPAHALFLATIEHFHPWKFIGVVLLLL